MEATDLSARLFVEPELAQELRSVDPLALTGQEARVAFWLNVYNARLRSELREHPRTGSLLRHRSLFRRAAWTVGGRPYSLDVMEHGVLRRNARPPAAVRRLLRGSDPRIAASPPSLDPRIHFALNCGARSCPVVRSYEPQGLDRQLQAATRAYLGQESDVDPAARTIVLPGLCRLYRRDFGDDDALRRFAGAHLGLSLDGWKLSFAKFDWTLVGPEA